MHAFSNKKYTRSVTSIIYEYLGPSEAAQVQVLLANHWIKLQQPAMQHFKGFAG